MSLFIVDNACAYGANVKGSSAEGVIPRDIEYHQRITRSCDGHDDYANHRTERQCRRLRLIRRGARIHGVVTLCFKIVVIIIKCMEMPAEYIRGVCGRGSAVNFSPRRSSCEGIR